VRFEDGVDILGTLPQVEVGGDGRVALLLARLQALVQAEVLS